MKKFFSKILIAILILGFFLAPITPKINTQNYFELAKNEIKAQAETKDWYIEVEVKFSNPYGGATTSTQILGPMTEQECSAYPQKNPGIKIIKPCFQSQTDVSGQTGSGVGQAATAGGYDNVDTGAFFNCKITNPIQCFVGILYLIWTAIAWIASLAAQILDFFIHYSLKSTSYSENQFVDSGWAVIRDIANIFFIVALLYVAGKTVLGMNASNNKKIISMVIVMALLINFSLFISKVVIDASNILGKVFYASIENVGPNGEDKNVSETGGEKSITVGLVKTFDPQKLFRKSGIDNINDHTATFLVLMLISGALMIYMIITFLSIAFLFVGRVVGLWILMIFAPLAFASYTIPDFSVPKFNHREWWSDLFKLSFMAPIFLFFLYLIISFGDAFKIVQYGEDGSSFTNGTAVVGDVDNMKTYLAVIIPFALIYVMLKQAKETTVKMAGDIAQSVNTAGKVLTGATLGLAAAGTAMAGRKIVGQTLARASRGETLSQRTDYGNMNQLQVGLSKLGKAARIDRLYGKDEGLHDIKTKKALGVTTGLGGLVNNSQRKIKEVEHGRHEIDEAMKKAGVSGIPYGNLSRVERDKVLEEFGKINKNDIESDITSGKTNLYDDSGTLIAGVKGKDGFYSANRQAIREKVEGLPGSTERAAAIANKDFDVTKNELTDQGKKKVENQLNIEFNKVMNKTKEKVTESKFDHAIKETKTSISNTEKIFSKGTSGSYDIRNFNPVADKKSALYNKAAIFLLSTIATSLRSGLKSTDMNPGKGQGDILKDLSTTVTSALKGMKIDIKSSGGGGGGHDSHGGGHDDHGGGHGGGHH